MSTSALTVFIGEAGEEICSMHRHSDGYPEGHGKELSELLSGMTIVNGLRVGDMRVVANGMGCLAAQVVHNFKNEAGGIYLINTEAADWHIDYKYIVTGKEEEEPKIEIIRGNKTLFKGPATEVKAWIVKNKIY